MDRDRYRGYLLVKNITNHGDFRFRKNGLSWINTAVRQACIASPLPAVVTIQIHAITTIAIIAAIFAPQTTAVRVKAAVVFIAVGIGAGQQQNITCLK